MAEKKTKKRKKKKNRQKTTQDRELLLEKNFLVDTKSVSPSSCHLPQGYQTQESSEVFHSEWWTSSLTGYTMKHEKERAVVDMGAE